MSEFVFVAPTWNTTAWVSAMEHIAPDLKAQTWPDVVKPKEVHYVGAWLPPPHVLRSFKNLKAIFSLGAGVDAILSDPTLPTGIPIIRVNDPDLTGRMSEYIVWQVLNHHRQVRRLTENQAVKKWDGFKAHAARDLNIGIMGIGVLGTDAAMKLRMMGFQVRGWSRNPKKVDGVTCFSGLEGMDTFLQGSDILVCLLPATPDTDGILNRSLFEKLSKSGPFGAGILINAGRGRQNNEADILACLDDGTLYAATLDVFRNEPLPATSPLWSHPRLTLTPHCAADSEPSTICSYIANQITRHKRGDAFENRVILERGY